MRRFLTILAFATFSLAGSLQTVSTASADELPVPVASAEPSGTERVVEANAPLEAAPPAEADVSSVTTPEVPAAPQPKLIVIDAAPYGVDPIVGTVVTTVLRQKAAEVGYDVLSPEASIEVARRVRMPYPPAPVELWRAMVAVPAARSAFARVWSQNGRYVVELVVGSADGGGPFYARDFVGTETLADDVARLFLSILPPPSAVTIGTPPSGSDVFADRRPGVSPAQITTAPQQPPAPARRRRRRARRKPLRWELSMQTESAIGVTSPGFYNHLVGARLDFRITPQIRLGAYLAYVNLEARDGRADNLLVMLQAENRVRVMPRSPFSVPLRVAAGYLPFNGPVIRASAGIGWQISDRFDLVADILSPMFWVLPEGVRVSMNLALEFGVRF
jgi:hypothetical protein